jgi:hypothetical protein|tara:strand:+ start:3423 stop:3533 length:111 start_codon:yes stop_codon:yes gene_type:complete
MVFISRKIKIKSIFKYLNEGNIIFIGFVGMIIDVYI